jgi:hypothetical protein
MDQVSIKYTNIFQLQTLQNLPKFGFLVWKQTIWQPCRLLEKVSCELTLFRFCCFQLQKDSISNFELGLDSERYF